MAKIDLLGHTFISYESALRNIYWTELSQLIIEKYGNKKITDNQQVEEILLFGFDYMTTKFKDLISSEYYFTFFMYVFWLHEESINIYLKWIDGQRLDPITEEEFAGNRRILKAILEQGCDIDLTWGQFPDLNKLEELDEKIHHLLYVGHWMYQFADHIALHKMIEECFYIDFEHNMVGVQWQHHYGEAYNSLIPEVGDSYLRGAFELDIVPELVQKINQCFSIDYQWACDLIFSIKEKNNPENPSLETVDPRVLPKKLSNKFKISKNDATIFYEGLSISRKNKMSLKDLILKPYSMNRLQTRPILIYNIDGVDRALVGYNKWPESIMVLATNGINWNSMPKEWYSNPCMSDFIQKKALDHSKLLEDEVENKTNAIDLLFVRNVTSFKQHQGNNVNIENELCGEIDFIIVNENLRKIFVVDCKYNKARYEAIGYRTDETNFRAKYEPKMDKKNKWVSENVSVINEHFQIINRNKGIDFTGYSIETVFFINTPIFYMFNGKYKAIPLNEVSDYLLGRYKYPNIMVDYKDNDGNRVSGIIEHPYFMKPEVREVN